MPDASTSNKSAPLIAPTAIAEPLDEYLLQVVQTLHQAVNQGMRRAAENPQAAAQPLADCQDILHTIMAGQVHDWLGE